MPAPNLTPSLEGRGTIAIERNVSTSPKRTLEQNGVLAILRLILGAGVTPAEGSVKPTAGFTFNKVIYPSLLIPHAARLTMRSPAARQ